MSFRPVLILALAAAAVGADLNRGKELFAQGNYAEAERELQSFVRDNDGNAQAHLYLGRALLAQDKLDEAERHLSRANEIESSGDSRIALALLAMERKNYDRAEELLRDAQGADLHYARGRLHFHRDRFEEAAQELERAIEQNADNAYAHYWAGLAYSRLKRPDKMLSHFEMFVRLRPNAPEARKVRAVLRTGR